MKNVLIRQLAYAYFLLDDATPAERRAITAGEADIDGMTSRRGWNVMDGEYLQDVQLVGEDVGEGTEELEALTAFAAFQRALVKDNGLFELRDALGRLDALVEKSGDEEYLDTGEALEAINAVRATLRRYAHGT